MVDYMGMLLKGLSEDGEETADGIPVNMELTNAPTAPDGSIPAACLTEQGATYEVTLLTALRTRDCLAHSTAAHHLATQAPPREWASSAAGVGCIIKGSCGMQGDALEIIRGQNTSLGDCCSQCWSYMSPEGQTCDVFVWNDGLCELRNSTLAADNQPVPAARSANANIYSGRNLAVPSLLSSVHASRNYLSCFWSNQAGERLCYRLIAQTYSAHQR